MLMPSLLFVLCAATAAESEIGLGEKASAPYVLVLGTAQDGGLPQIGCAGAHCTPPMRTRPSGGLWRVF